jgi:hypothetical protein
VSSVIEFTALIASLVYWIRQRKLRFKEEPYHKPELDSHALPPKSITALKGGTNPAEMADHSPPVELDPETKPVELSV